MTIEKLYSVDEIADLLKINILTIYKWIKEKKVKAHKIGKRFYIKESDLQALLNK